MTPEVIVSPHVSNVPILRTCQYRAQQCLAPNVAFVGSPSGVEADTQQTLNSTIWLSAHVVEAPRRWEVVF